MNTNKKTDIRTKKAPRVCLSYLNAKAPRLHGERDERARHTAEQARTWPTGTAHLG